MRVLFLAVFLWLAASQAFAADVAKESTYDRVMRTHTIRCGYGLWGEYLGKDPNTGKMSGIYYDFVTVLAQNLGLKVEWTEEVGWGNFIAGLDSGRYDAFCTFVVPNAERAREADFLRPLFYVGSDVFVHAGDTRFDGHLERLNEPGVTLAIYEGDVYSKIVAHEYRRAKILELPQLTTEAELLETVASGKATATITDGVAGRDYMAHNAGKLRIVPIPGSFRALPSSLAVPGGEYRFQRMLDLTALELLDNGTMKRILAAHTQYPGTLFPVAKPYEVPK